MNLSFNIAGNLQSKSNSRRLVKNRHTGKMFSIKSDKAREFVESALWQLKAQMNKTEFQEYPIKEDVIMTADIYYQSRRSDLDDTLLCDVLQEVGIIENDRQIRRKNLTAHIHKENPRVEFSVETF